MALPVGYGKYRVGPREAVNSVNPQRAGIAVRRGFGKRNFDSGTVGDIVGDKVDAGNERIYVAASEDDRAASKIVYLTGLFRISRI